jgi:hypothetical protein
LRPATIKAHDLRRDRLEQQPLATC